MIQQIALKPPFHAGTPQAAKILNPLCLPISPHGQKLSFKSV
tara:strand:- start:634 stop:759 length:126 start_codon:yes stop_codon:yes gene_type:complete